MMIQPSAGTTREPYLAYIEPGISSGVRPNCIVKDFKNADPDYDWDKIGREIDVRLGILQAEPTEHPDILPYKARRISPPLSAEAKAKISLAQRGKRKKTEKLYFEDLAKFPFPVVVNVEDLRIVKSHIIGCLRVYYNIEIDGVRRRTFAGGSCLPCEVDKVRMQFWRDIQTAKRREQ